MLVIKPGWLMITCNYTEITHQWSEQELADKLVLLPENLRSEALRKRQWMDKQLSISGKLLLINMLNETGSSLSLDLLKHNAYHRPYIDGAPDLNIAHSGNMVICCVADSGDVGIDIELVRNIDLDDYTDYFTPTEWTQINNYPNKYDGFYDFWTRKEAVLKAIGTGFHTPLLSVDVSEESFSYDNITYYIRPVAINGDYKCHVACTAINSEIKVIPVKI
jgi:4'-phosphopantetheinyl transferase